MSVCRSQVCIVNVREYEVQDTFPLQNATDAQTFRQAAGTVLCMSIDRPSLQFAMSVMMSGSVAGGARSTMCSATSGRDLAVQIHQADLKTLYVYTDTDWAADELTRKSVSCTV